MDMYKYCDNNGKHISLHDCHVTSMSYENGIVTFVFADGIWLGNEHPENETGKIVRTDKAEVKINLEFENEDDMTVYVFKEKHKKTYREEWKISKLVEYVNKKKHALEFLYRYDGYRSVIFECCLWSKKKPYHRECEIKVMLKDMKFYWNELCEESEW